MLSEQSKQGITHAFNRAARSGLIRDANDSIDIAVTENSKLSEQPDQRVLVITASSFVFRLMTLFHVAVTPESRTYYGGEGATDEQLREVFSEIVNLCGGALNRELSRHFPHLAMSIPYALSAECLKYVEQLKPEYLSSFSITINQSVHLEATLCMSCSAPVHIPIVENMVVENAGELEMF
jgi:hypothetical protein